MKEDWIGPAALDEASLTEVEKAEMRLYLPKEHTVVIAFLGTPYHMTSFHLTHGFYQRIGEAMKMEAGDAQNETFVRAYAYLLADVTGLPEEKVAEKMSWALVSSLSDAIKRLKEKMNAAVPTGRASED